MKTETNVNQSNEKRGKKSGAAALKVAGGVLAGAAAGAIAGVLFAPDSGQKTRKKIVDKTKAAAFDAKRQMVDTLKGIGKKKNKPEAKK
jgi:gas vesicle protein